MIKNIVFDMGNVLIEFEGKDIVNRIAESKEDAALIYNIFFGSIEWIMLDKGTITTENLLKTVNRKLPVYLHQKIAEALKSWHVNPTEIQGIYELAKQLKMQGYNLYVLSNTSTAYHQFRENIPAIKFMDGEMISADEHLLKPSHAIFERFVEKFAVIPEETYFIDDSAPNVLAAVEVGFKSSVFHGDTKALRMDLAKHGVLDSNISAVIFDLDGVVVSTDTHHFIAWKKLADQLEIPFSQEDYSAFRGVSRMNCIDILEKIGGKSWTMDEKSKLADLKNSWYKAELESLDDTAIMPGVLDLLAKLDTMGILTAIGSSSQNAGYILKRLGLENQFDCVVDGSHIVRSKPYPDVFVSAADKLGVPYNKCLVIEDATAGIDAALAAGMTALGIGDASSYKKNDFSAKSIEDFPDDIL